MGIAQFGWLSERTRDAELIDGDSLGVAERQQALGQLPLVNRFLGGTKVVLRELESVDATYPAGKRMRILDVGCGVGDIPEAIARWAAVAQRPIAIVGLDSDQVTLDLAIARRKDSVQPITYVRGNALRLPARDQSFDVVTANMFCHHFFGNELVLLLREMTRVSADTVIVNDLHRHWVAFVAFRIASRVFLRGHVVRHDGEVSIRRGFVANELKALAENCREFKWTVRRRVAFRLALVGRRIS